MTHCYFQGSVLFNWYKHGKLERSEGSSITEGIGQGRVTENMKGAPVDDAMTVLDQDVVEMVWPSTWYGWVVSAPDFR